MSGVRRVIEACWPAALLVAFLGTFRTTGSENAPADAASNCDPAPRSDAAALERCLAVEPRNVELMTDLGDLHAAAGDAARAASMYRRALAADPDDGDVHLRLGQLLLAGGDAAGALVEGEAALRSQPGSLAAERLVERARREL